MITDLCLHASNTNDIESWNYATGSRVLESEVITNTLFLKFGAQKYAVEA